MEKYIIVQAHKSDLYDASLSYEIFNSKEAALESLKSTLRDAYNDFVGDFLIITVKGTDININVEDSF